MTEWEFLTALTAEADCDLLLDVNNVYVSSVNHGFDAPEFLDAMPRLPGAADPPGRPQPSGGSAHRYARCSCPPAVWDLYRHTVQRLGAVPTMIERDGNIPALAELVAELQLARNAAAPSATRAA